MKPLVALLLLALAAGCTTTASRQVVAYQSLGVTGHTVRAALLTYSEALSTGRVPHEKQLLVADNKARYEMAFTMAVTAARGNMQAPTPHDVQQWADNLTLLLKAVVTTTKATPNQGKR